jgi:predicted AlkP superfamily phosphohydrolase/phosphomutase
MLREEPLWSILSKNGVTVGMANVPATFPVLPVNGYMISGMLTRGKNCEDGVLCSPKLSEVEGGQAVYPKALAAEIERNVGDVPLDCERMPSAEELKGDGPKVINSWLQEVDDIRRQQLKLFEYLLANHPTQFTMMVQSCEDRVGHWLYPIQPYNAGYEPEVNNIRLDAFPNQYKAFDRLLGMLMGHLDKDTYLVVFSDHGIKPLREFEQTEPGHKMVMDHGGTTPVIANHDFEDADDVPGVIIVTGPTIRHNVRLMGLEASVYDIAPTVLSLYGIPKPPQMQGRVLTELFSASASAAKSAAK